MGRRTTDHGISADLAEKAPTISAWRCDPRNGLVHGSGLELAVNFALSVRCRQAGIMQSKCPVGDPWHKYGDSRGTLARGGRSVIPWDSGRFPRARSGPRCPDPRHRTPMIVGDWSRRRSARPGRRPDRWDQQNPVGQTPGGAAGSEPDVKKIYNTCQAHRRRCIPPYGKMPESRDLRWRTRLLERVTGPESRRSI